MLTDSGIGMAAGLTFALIGIACMVATITQYRRRGPVLCAAYFAAAKGEREKLRTAKAYRCAGNLFLYLTVISVCVGASLIFDHAGFALIGATVAAGGMLGGFLYIATQ